MSDERSPECFVCGTTEAGKRWFDERFDGALCARCKEYPVVEHVASMTVALHEMRKAGFRFGVNAVVRELEEWHQSELDENDDLALNTAMSAIRVARAVRESIE